MKKILSLLITAAMIAVMLPNAFATETAPEVGDEFVYDLTSNALKAPEENEYVVGGTISSNYNKYSNGEYLDPTKSEKWVYGGMQSGNANYPQWTGEHFRWRLEGKLDSRFALKLSVPHEGKYTITIEQDEIYEKVGVYAKKYVAGASNVYITDSVGTLSEWSAEGHEKLVTFRFFKDINVTSDVYEFPQKGDYYFIFDTDRENVDFLSFLEDAVEKKLLEGTSSYSRIYNTLSKITLTYQGAAGPEKEDISGKINYEEKDHAGEDTASIIAFKVLGENGEITESNIIKDGIPTDITFGDVCEDITAPAAPEGYKFLYWAKGNSAKKQILSFSEKLSGFRPNEGVNYLMAVYEAENDGEGDAKFYNANGQLLDLKITTDNKLPSYPSMPGYGKARAWALKNPDGTYTEYTTDAPENTSGTMIFMAVYDDLEANITVTVDGEERKVKYGDPVKCVPKDLGNGEFMYWTKEVNGVSEIVSIDSDYTFLAFCNCEVKSVFGGGIEELSKKMRNIILTRFTAGDETAVMAEFIGCEDAIEKGIMFGNMRVPMSTASTQFAVIDDTVGEDTATGYAIIREGEALKIVTDGSVSIGKEVE